MSLYYSCVGKRISKLQNLDSEKVFDSTILYQNFEKWEKNAAKTQKGTKGKFQVKIDKINKVKIGSQHMRYRSELFLNKVRSLDNKNMFKLSLSSFPKTHVKPA